MRTNKQTSRTQWILTLWKQLGLTSGLLFIIVPAALAEPGWQEWKQITGSDQPLPYSAGFSNTELGGYLDYENICSQAAVVAQEPFTYWYRLSDLVFAIGTGSVENKCQIGDEVVTVYSSTAIRNGIDEPYCLEVNTDVGSGLRIRAERRVTAQQIGFLPNGTRIFPSSLPTSIMTDETGRQWLSLQQHSEDIQLESWASVSAEPGKHVNFRLCEASV
ncbi:MAG: hypothetical protein AAGI69_27350 [Cyanobacteria bacterium P01_H01_bin.21]